MFNLDSYTLKVMLISYKKAKWNTKKTRTMKMDSTANSMMIGSQNWKNQINLMKCNRVNLILTEKSSQPHPVNCLFIWFHCRLASNQHWVDFFTRKTGFFECIILEGHEFFTGDQHRRYSRKINSKSRIQNRRRRDYFVPIRKSRFSCKDGTHSFINML